MDAHPDKPGAKGPPSPMSRRNRILIGCAIAFGLTALLGAAGMFGLFFFAFGTPRQIPVAAVVGPETVAVVRVRGDVGDPGVGALVQRFADGMTAVQTGGAGAPPSLSWVRPLLAFNNRQSMSYITPREIGIVMEPDAAGSGTHAVVIVALQNLPRLHQWMFTWMLSRAAHGTLPRRGGVSVLPFGHGAHVALTRGTVYVSESADALGAVLDRLPGTTGASPVGDRLALVGADGDGEAVALFGRGVPLVPDASGCEALAVTMDVVDANRIDIRLEPACSEATAEERAAMLSAAWSALGAGLPAGVGITPSPSTPETASIFGVGAWIDGAFKGAGQRPTPPAVPLPVASPAPQGVPGSGEDSDSGENPGP